MNQQRGGFKSWPCCCRVRRGCCWHGSLLEPALTRFKCQANVGGAGRRDVVQEHRAPARINLQRSLTSAVSSNTPPRFFLKWLLPGKLTELLNLRKRWGGVTFDTGQVFVSLFKKNILYITRYVFRVLSVSCQITMKEVWQRHNDVWINNSPATAPSLQPLKRPISPQLPL